VPCFFKASQLEHFFHNAETAMGMRVGFLTFVYVPIPDPPLKEQKMKRKHRTKKTRSNSTVQHKKQIAFQQFGK